MPKSLLLLTHQLNWQIWAYSTAAPDFIGDFATVKDGDGNVIREGSNGWVCLAFNPMPEGGIQYSS